ncbi:MAG: diaminopimelate epimerase [Butyrivibrio sp.]|nr:diaminopimelate epimerase [Butyrivibrio sp.]
MKFTKMQGIGNDYVYVNCFEEKAENPAELSVLVSDRHFGIGSDGLILIKPSDRADFYMDMYNADGSSGKMCGNGIRCVGKYVYDNGLTDKTELSVETLSGIKYLKLNVNGGKVSSVRVNMGEPVFAPSEIPVSLDGELIKDRTLSVGGREYKITCVSMGNPHCVVRVDDVDALKIEEIGPLFENNEVFPDRINTEFIRVIDENTIQMRVWERGSGETLACGTGACAAAVAAMLNGLCGGEVTVKLLGGDLKISWDRDSNIVYMEGPAEVSFTGEWNNT